MRDYLSIARPDHWIKNIFSIPGAIFAIIFSTELKRFTIIDLLFIAFILCFASSANYTINEWLDRFSDMNHPVKFDRPAAQGRIKLKWVVVQYSCLVFLSTFFAFLMGTKFVILLIIFLVLGILYNVKPFRTKDRIFLDVISESANNPIRFLFGWFCITDGIPPSSALIGYWTAGTFLMTMKRYGEKKQLMNQLGANSEAIFRYRPSLGHYTLNQLFEIALFCSICTSAFLGIFMMKYSEFLVITIPSLAFCFVEYFKIAEKEDSPAQNPELLYKESRLILASGSFLVLSIVGIYIEGLV